MQGAAVREFRNEGERRAEGGGGHNSKINRALVLQKREVSE